MHKLAFWSELESAKVGGLDERRKFYTDKVVRSWHSCPEKLWCPIPGGVRGPRQPEPVGGSPARDRRLEPDEP